MLAINVSIPNLTVARLEQFRPPQVRIQAERPTDVGLTENKPSFVRKPQGDSDVISSYHIYASCFPPRRRASAEKCCYCDIVFLVR